MDGRLLVGGLVAACVVTGGALVYFQDYAYYREVGLKATGVTDGVMELTEIRLTTRDGGFPELVPVTEFSAIDAATSPLKFRGCFHIAQSLDHLKRTYLAAENATPLRPPHWFKCFDTARLTQDLASGAAFAFLGERDVVEGVDRLVAVYADGRAFAWHQFGSFPGD